MTKETRRALQASFTALARPTGQKRSLERGKGDAQEERRQAPQAVRL